MWTSFVSIDQEIKAGVRKCNLLPSLAGDALALELVGAVDIAPQRRLPDEQRGLNKGYRQWHRERFTCALVRR
jgi:hypothetical protein